MRSTDNILLFRLQVEYSDGPIAASVADNAIDRIEADPSDIRALHCYHLFYALPPQL